MDDKVRRDPEAWRLAYVPAPQQGWARNSRRINQRARAKAAGLVPTHRRKAAWYSRPRQRRNPVVDRYLQPHGLEVLAIRRDPAAAVAGEGGEEEEDRLAEEEADAAAAAVAAQVEEEQMAEAVRRSRWDTEGAGHSGASSSTGGGGGGWGKGSRGGWGGSRGSAGGGSAAAVATPRGRAWAPPQGPQQRPWSQRGRSPGRGPRSRSRAPSDGQWIKKVMVIAYSEEAFRMLPVNQTRGGIVQNVAAAFQDPARDMAACRIIGPYRPQ